MYACSLNLREILSCCQAAVSYPLASGHDIPAKTNKSALLDLQSKGGDYLTDHIPENDAVVFDGMAAIQALRDVPSVLGELADVILMYMIKLARKYQCTFFGLCHRSVTQSEHPKCGTVTLSS